MPFAPFESLQLATEVQLNRNSDSEHRGCGKEPLHESCGNIEFVHDVCSVVSAPNDDHIAPPKCPEQTHYLTNR
jgi:hypothetical protein